MLRLSLKSNRLAEKEKGSLSAKEVGRKPARYARRLRLRHFVRFVILSLSLSLDFVRKPGGLKGQAGGGVSVWSSNWEQGINNSCTLSLFPDGLCILDCHFSGAHFAAEHEAAGSIPGCSGGSIAVGVECEHDSVL